MGAVSYLNALSYGGTHYNGFPYDTDRKKVFNWFFIIFVIFLQVYLNIEERENNILIALSLFNFVAFNFMAFKVHKYKKSNKERS